MLPKLFIFISKIFFWSFVFIYWLILYVPEVWVKTFDKRHDRVLDELLTNKKFERNILNEKKINNEIHNKQDEKISEKNISDEKINKENIQENQEKNNIQEKIKEKELEKQKNQRFLYYIFNEAIKQEHSSAKNKYTQNDINRICSLNLYVCDFTHFIGDFSNTQRLYYKAIIIYIINNIDEYLNSSEKISNIMSSLRIDQKWTWRRWYAGHHTMLINLPWISNKIEFMEVFTHELWHIIDLWVIKWSWWKLDSNFTEFGKKKFYLDDPSIDFYSYSWLSEDTTKSWKSRLDFVSWYAMTNPFEDFAESINMYINHYWVFEQMAETSLILHRKFNYIENLLDNNYLYTDTKNTEKAIENPERRPWDTTKIRL